MRRSQPTYSAHRFTPVSAIDHVLTRNTTGTGVPDGSHTGHRSPGAIGHSASAPATEVRDGPTVRGVVAGGALHVPVARVLQIVGDVVGVSRSGAWYEQSDRPESPADAKADPITRPMAHTMETMAK